MKSQLPSLQQFNLNNKKILIRADLNVPIEDGKVTDTTRIDESLETIKHCLTEGSKVLLVSHLGRPKAGASAKENEEFSLKPLITILENKLNQKVEFVADWKKYDFAASSKSIFLLENIRFEAGETTCDALLSQKLASLVDLVVIDAFGTAHRKHASTYGVVEYAKQASAGILLSREIESLNKALKNPKKPVMAIVGGAKVSTKLLVIENLIEKMNHIILGGGIINTFLLAQGFPVGQSLVERELVDTAQMILKKAKKYDCEIHLPIDVVVTKDFSNPKIYQTKLLNEVADDDIIMDVGAKSARRFANAVSLCQTILWNGPLGVFEHPQFANGTRELTQAIVKQTQAGAFTIAGGGDTIAAINQFEAFDQISYISTGGGAFLECIEGKELPVVSALLNKNNQL